VWSPKGTTLRVIRYPTLQVSQFLFPGQRSDTFLTDHVYQRDQIFIRKQLLKAGCAVTSAATNSVFYQLTLWGVSFLNRGAGGFPGERMGMCVLSSNKWQNTSTSYNIIKECCRPVQLGPPGSTEFDTEV